MLCGFREGESPSQRMATPTPEHRSFSYIAVPQGKQYTIPLVYLNLFIAGLTVKLHIELNSTQLPKIKRK